MVPTKMPIQAHLMPITLIFCTRMTSLNKSYFKSISLKSLQLQIKVPRTKMQEEVTNISSMPEEQEDRREAMGTNR